MLTLIIPAKAPPDPCQIKQYIQVADLDAVSVGGHHPVCHDENHRCELLILTRDSLKTFYLCYESERLQAQTRGEQAASMTSRI